MDILIFKSVLFHPYLGGKIFKEIITRHQQYEEQQPPPTFHYLFDNKNKPSIRFKWDQIRNNLDLMIRFNTFVYFKQQLEKAVRENRVISFLLKSIDYGCQYNRFEFVKFIQEEGYGDTPGICSNQAYQCAILNIDLFKYLVEKRLKQDSKQLENLSIMELACSSSSVELGVIKIILENEMEKNINIDNIITSLVNKPKPNQEDAEILQYIIDHNKRSCKQSIHITSQMMDNTARFGNYPLVVYLHSLSMLPSNEKKDLFIHIDSFTVDAMNWAKSLDIVKFLNENRTEGCTTLALDLAAQFDRLSIVEYLHQHDKGCTMDALNYCKSIEVTKFLHSHRTEGCSTEAMDHAAQCGLLEKVKFLNDNRTEGCTKMAMTEGARYSHLQVFQYLHENRTEGWDSSIYNSIQNTSILDYINQHKDLLPKEPEKPSEGNESWMDFFL